MNFTRPRADPEKSIQHSFDTAKSQSTKSEHTRALPAIHLPGRARPLAEPLFGPPSRFAVCKGDRVGSRAAPEVDGPGGPSYRGYVVAMCHVFMAV